eukprot:1547204-Pleurochrysis_carterae.AAC.2
MPSPQHAFKLERLEWGTRLQLLLHAHGKRQLVERTRAIQCGRDGRLTRSLGNMNPYCRSQHAVCGHFECSEMRMKTKNNLEKQPSADWTMSGTRPRANCS